MDKITNPIMEEIHQLYEEYGRMRKAGEGDADGRQTALYEKAFSLFSDSVSGFSPEEMINGFKFGTELLQRNIAGMIISDKYFHPDYIPVMKESVEEDIWISNELFIRPLRDCLTKDEFIELLKQSLHSRHLQVRRNSLVVVKEENLSELESDVQKLFDDPDSKIARYARRVAKAIKNR